MSIELRKFEDMPESRSSRWCLGLQDDSVFADFDFDEQGCVTLLRISFDGYGCCRTPGARAMDSETSQRWISLVEANDFDSGEMQSILTAYLSDNSEVIWKDALEEYNLLNDRTGAIS